MVSQEPVLGFSVLMPTTPFKPSPEVGLWYKSDGVVVVSSSLISIN